MAPAELLARWRGEILQEHAALEPELNAANRAVQAAEAAITMAAEDFAALNNFTLAGLRPLESMATALRDRLLSGREAVDQARRQRGAARASVDSLMIRMTDLLDAVRQIDAAVTASKVIELPRSADAPRRKNPVIEWDPLERVGAAAP